MTPERFHFLLHRFRLGRLTTEEREEFFEAIASGKFRSEMEEDFSELLKDEQVHAAWSPELESQTWHHINAEMMVQAPVRKLSWWWAAASVFLLIGIGGYFYFRPGGATQILPAARVENPAFKNDVLPGTNKAMLTLSNGKAIVLDSANNGLLAQQGMASVQNANGSLLYQAVTAAESNTLIYNSLTTAKGQQYPLTLSDGTKVWLNAGSSIRFPVIFAAGERKVEITGEAYFEVTHNASRPFHVMANGQDITDLGTRFNVNAYTNEGPMRITLLEGAVAINNKILKPGQQAETRAPGETKIIDHADLEGAVAWKNGQFHFRKTDISTLMRQLERWYDIQIIYEGPVSAERFTGDIPRYATLTEMLSILEMTNHVHFKLEGKKLTILQ